MVRVPIMTAIATTSPALLQTLTERELYRLAFEISEELVRREMGKLANPAGIDPPYMFDSADDNWGCY